MTEWRVVTADKPKDPAAPGKWVDGHYICACEGCWACKGHVKDCTCDVDWDELAERKL